MQTMDDLAPADRESAVHLKLERGVYDRPDASDAVDRGFQQCYIEGTQTGDCGPSSSNVASTRDR